MMVADFDPEALAAFEESWRLAGQDNTTGIVLQPDGRYRIELFDSEGTVLVRTFARDPNLAPAFAEIMKEKGVEGSRSCPCCEVLV